MAASTTRDHLRDCLDQIDFPATKDDLLDAAVRRGDSTAVQALRAIPPVDYANLTEVFRAAAPDDLDR
ncbi:MULTISPECIES: DUF2795 domain-containing protein [Actinokineospora]|uniref:DUF2795 domain-containing protein n=1 Tax=Actinokineospora fastidiosa TaxID=1816 RepID=A0A918GGI4_9PSEU|nr:MULTISPECIES: DUF2795 domain-containing protein [Actinokineospora]UVS79843.1 hypothetical protein Actkin_03593 [Actinokineospora sp. UTMC 2448]GGS31206.1 hypothetical protein GCM10010171_26340 [Actinokineospora fastidiosa]